MTHDATVMIPAVDRPVVRRTLSVVIRVGSLLLANGATTDEVEQAMRSIARASGLDNVQAIVQFATISVSYAPEADAEPITIVRLARNRTTDYARLTAASELANRLSDSQMTVDDALDEVQRIESSGAPYPTWLLWLASAISAGGATVLFGGGPIEVMAAGVATIAARPALEWMARSGLPTFFRNVIGPALAVTVVIVLMALGLPANGPVAVTGAIVIFLPGGALAAGMRDLIDGSILSGTARVFEAIMLGAAVGIGATIGLGLVPGWGADIELDVPALANFSIATQAVAAAVACAAFGIQNGVPARRVLAIALIGSAGLVVERTTRAVGVDPVLATAVAAVLIGGLGRWRANRRRTSATIWIGPATLPLLPGLVLVAGLLSAQAAGGTELVSALMVGFALGIGSAFGDIMVATVQRINQSIVQPVVVAPAAGLVEEGLSWVSRTTGRTPSSAGTEGPEQGEP
jgi:uncharacterized membrane protein YjjP (DUF1212 family)